MTMLNAPPAWHPFAALNLRYNPFGELSREDRARAAVAEVDQWAKWLAVGGRRAVQFIGDCGRGKTTHLLALAARLPAASYVYFPIAGPLPPIPDQDWLLIDEAQRTPRRAWRRTLDRGPALALGTHNDRSRPLARAGYAVETVHVAAMTNARAVRAIMNRRIELARRAPGAVPQLTADDAARLAARYGDDLRAMEGYLYERVQQYAGGEHAEVRFVDRVG